MSKGKILFISSNPNTAKTAKKRLTDLGYKLVEIDNIKTFSDLPEKPDLELCLTDIKLKTTAGEKKLKETLSLNNNIPLIYYITENDPSDLKKIKNLKPGEYVLLPGTDKDIHTTIAAALSIANLEKKLAIAEKGLNDYFQKNSEQKVKKHILETLITNLPGMIYRCLNDHDWTMQFVSDGCMDLTGYKPSDFINNRKISYNQIIHPEDTENVWRTIQEAINTDKTFTLTYRIHTRDNQIKWVWERGLLIESEESDQMVIEGFIFDITERVQMESRLRSIIENMPVMMDAFDENHNILAWNRECEKVTGYNASEIVNNPKAIEMLYPDKEYREKMLAKWNKTGSNFREWEWDISCKDGGVRTISWSNLSDTIPIPGWASWAIGQDVTDRKITMEELRRFGLAVEQSFDGIAMIDLDENIMYVNPTWAKMHGYSREELIGNTAHIFHPDTNIEDKIFPELLKNKDNDGWVGLQNRLRKDGTTFTIWMTITLLKNEEGQPIGFVGTARDITESIKTEKALMESEKKYRLLADTAQDMILSYDNKGKITYFNKAVLNLTGYSENNLINMNITTLLPKSETHLILKQDKSADENDNQRLIYRTELVTKTHQHLPVEISSTPFIKDNQVIGRLIIARNISKRLEVEKALKESEEKYRRIIDNALELIYSCTLEGKITFVSPQTSYYGYTPEEILGQNIFEFVHPDDVELITNNLRRRIELGEEITTECRLIGKDGTEYFVEEIGKVVRYGEDSVQITGTIRDITDRKQAEDALLKSEEKYRVLIENAIDGIFVGQNRKIKFINPKAMAITGYTMDELNEIDPYELIHPDDRKMLIEQHNQILQGQKISQTMQFRITDKNKNIKWLELNKLLITWENEPATLHFISDISERKKAEENLKESEERFRTMADFTYDWESWIGPDGKYIYISPSCEQVTGYRPEEFLHDPELMQKITHPEDQEKIIKHMNDRLDINHPHIIEFRILNRNGMHLWIEHICQPVYSPDGRYLGRRFSNRDITERKAMLEALMESEQKYSTVIEKAKDGIVVIQDQIMRFANKTMQEISGYTTEELVGRKYLDIVAEETKELVAERYKLRLEGKNPPSFYEMKIQCKDETVKDIELSVGIIKYFGKPASVAILRDITERKKVEEHIRHNLIAMESATEGIAITNSKGEFTYLNLAHARIFSYDFPFELIRHNWRELYDDQQLQQIENDIMPILQKDGYWSGEFIGKKKDGTLFPEELSLTALEDGSTISIVRDISDRKRTEEQQKKLKEMLERAERMESLGILAGGVAHDLNNMLGPLVGYSDLILEEINDNSPTKKMVERIGKASRIAADIIQDLLTLARRGRYEMEPTNINEVIENYLDSPSCQRLVNSRPDIKFEKNFTSSINNILGSSSHLSKMVMNLIINACDAMLKGGVLTIETSQQYLEILLSGYDKIEKGDYIILKVRDTGMGIDAKDLSKIFEPYYSKKKMGTSGSGLGLAVVYGIIKDHRGYYDVFSEIGKGTEFVLYFPISNVAKTKSANEKINTYSGTETILVVDDVLEQREMASDLLASLGYQVITAASGREAVALLKNQQVDLVMMDMILENGFDGLDTYREILKLYPEQKAIIASGYSATERVDEMQRLGAGAYIKKPYSRNSLAQAVRETLDTPVKSKASVT